VGSPQGKWFMRLFIWTLLILVCGLIVVALVRHWVVFETDSTPTNGDSSHVNIGVTVNKDRAREDLAAVRKEASELASRATHGVEALRSPKTMEGTISDVNQPKSQFTLKTADGSEQVFQVDSKFKIEGEKNEADALARLQPGERVTVKYHEKDGTKTAVSVKVNAAKVS